MVYLLLFLSGAAALVCQVAWVRSLALVFGQSHLAVTAVLSVFMGGLAVGGYAVGRRVDRIRRPLRAYGFLQLGIAAFALVFEGLMTIYPSLYAPLARGRDDAALYLTVVRLFFSTLAVIAPAILIGGTLPVVARAVCRGPEDLRRRLAFLFGANTLGLVGGAVLAGFVLLRLYAVSTTYHLAIALAALVGLASVLLPARADAESAPEAVTATVALDEPDGAARPALTLWGIGIVGFCALGYEVLWTRVLTTAIGASVYGYTIVLATLLAGIALGSQACGLLVRLSRRAVPGSSRPVAWFGLTQLAIGVTALAVTVALRDVAANAVRLQNLFAGGAVATFTVRVWAGVLLAFLYTFVPALFMGAAFPLAGEALARHRNSVGRAVGDLVGSIAVGALLGTAASSLLLVRVVGIERSLEILAVLNLGVGLAVLASLRKARWLAAGVAAGAVAVIAVLAISPSALRIWDVRRTAVFRGNQPEAFATPEMVSEAVENTDVLYYGEGDETIVSVIKVKGGEQALITNGRVEASTDLQERQNQLTLGHLPMLLARDPREVLVVGLGSGMTAGAVAAHPGVGRVTVAEIEPKMLGVARTFAKYNHRVLENPKVGVLPNDGRNFLMTTDRKFDVITSDPMHPWSKGSGYLDASEYFALAAAHLRPGGVMAQGLPLYELTPQDLASVVRTFRQHFAHTMLWLVHYDAVLVGSGAPFLVDQAEIERRLADPAIAGDLGQVEMGSATDLLSYFAMGTDGMTRLARDGVLNTDDRPFLEFSAPFSIASPAVMALDVGSIAALRENILPYLKPAEDPATRDAEEQKWTLHLEAGRAGDRALALFLGLGPGDPEFAPTLRRLNQQYPWYAPGKLLWTEYQAALALEPRLLQQSSMTLLAEDGATTVVDMSAVLVPVSRTRASIMFVDSRARVVYGQVYVNDYERSGFADRFALEVMGAVHAAYESEAADARVRKQALPPASQTLRRIKAVIGSKVQSVQPGS